MLWKKKNKTEEETDFLDSICEALNKETTSENNASEINKKNNTNIKKSKRSQKKLYKDKNKSKSSDILATENLSLEKPLNINELSKVKEMNEVLDRIDYSFIKNPFIINNFNNETQHKIIFRNERKRKKEKKADPVFKTEDINQSIQALNIDKCDELCIDEDNIELEFEDNLTSSCDMLEIDTFDIEPYEELEIEELEIEEIIESKLPTVVCIELAKTPLCINKVSTIHSEEKQAENVNLGHLAPNKIFEDKAIEQVKMQEVDFSELDDKKINNTKEHAVIKQSTKLDIIRMSSSKDKRTSENLKAIGASPVIIRENIPSKTKEAQKELIKDFIEDITGMYADTKKILVGSTKRMLNKNIIEIVLDNNLTILSGEEAGRLLYEKQLKNYIDQHSKNIIILPEQIRDISISFIEGMFSEIISNLSKKSDFDKYYLIEGNARVVGKIEQIIEAI